MIHSEGHILRMDHTTLETVSIRPYSRKDRPAVTNLLRIIPTLYPNGGAWLDSRLDDIESKKASCTLAFKNDFLGGVLIDVSKGLRRRKICTLYISPEFSKQGLGSKLFSSCASRWVQSAIDTLHITVARERLSQIEGFLFAKNFELIGVERQRYGNARDEFVYSVAMA